jgi:hypothetical protein
VAGQEAQTERRANPAWGGVVCGVGLVATLALLAPRISRAASILTLALLAPVRGGAWVERAKRWPIQ